MPQKTLSQVIRKFKDVFSIDLRALAFFRMFMGLIICLYLIPRFQFIYAFFSDFGIAPRGDVINLTSSSFLSFHFISGQMWVVLLLLLSQAVIAILLMLGYRTRLMTFLSWFFLISLQNRNPWILNYGDQLFRVLLFWAIFLPLGAVWSIDSIWAKDNRLPKKWFSVTTLAILLQVVLFYVINWFLKDSVEWKGVYATTHSLSDLFDFSIGFNATYLAISIGYIVTPFGEWLLNFPAILKPVTIGYIFFELIGPLLLISPIKTKEFRYLSLAIFFIIIHGMLSLMLYTGLFQLFCYAGLILFLPSEFWDWLQRKLFTGEKALKIYYDQECELCTTGVCALKGTTGSDQMLPIQSNKEMLGVTEITTIIVEDESGQRYEQVDAFIKLFENSTFTRWIASLLKIKPIYKLASIKYEILSKNRHHISKLILFIKPKKPIKSRLINIFAQGLAGMALVLVLFWNYGNVVKKDYFANPYLASIMYNLRLDQYWGMFSPRPTQESVWLAVSGKLVNGTQVNVLDKTKSEVSFVRQLEPPDRFWSQGWRNYFIDYPARNNVHTEIFSRYLCHEWNEGKDLQGEELRELTLYTYFQVNSLEGRGPEIERFRYQFVC
ncbi:MAG: DCC1-like thiol-disulfide oxidoreductase family protein [Patescibacteria group bacterium]